MNFTIRPWTPSKYELLCNDQQGSLRLLSSKDNLSSELTLLFSTPNRENSDYYKLQDIILNGEGIDKRNVNLLFAINQNTVSITKTQ